MSFVIFFIFIFIFIFAEIGGDVKNSQAAPTIFSSQLQPIYIEKAIHRSSLLQYFGCSPWL